MVLLAETPIDESVIEMKAVICIHKIAVQPFYVAFLNAHDDREPSPFTGYVFGQWMQKMYNRFFDMKNWKFKSSAQYDLLVRDAQNAGFESWLLAESLKPGCYRNQDLMNAPLMQRG